MHFSCWHTWFSPNGESQGDGQATPDKDQDGNRDDSDPSSPRDNDELGDNEFSFEISGSDLDNIHASKTLEGGLNPGSGSSQSSSQRRRISIEVAKKRIGTTLGKYKFTGILGKGGMGVVYRAHDTMIQRDVAVKLLPAEFAENDTALKRFLAEARSAGRLSHPNVVQIYDVNSEGAEYYIVMELVKGRSLDLEIKEKGSLHWKEATRVCAQAARGLQAAHQAGLIHRDIKPSNLMRSEDKTIKVTDFGLAKAHGVVDGELTADDQVLGTPYYMSPEQCDSKPVDGRSDIYSLGATYFSLLTGVKPYEESDSLIQILYAHCKKPLPDPHNYNKNIPEACRAVIERSMAKKPDDRYQAAAEMVADLEAILEKQRDDNESIPSLAVSDALAGDSTLSGNRKKSNLPSDSSISITLSRRGLSATLVVLVILATAIIGGIVFFINQSNQLKQQASSSDSRSSSLAAAVLPEENPIRIGILHSLTGTMRDSETPVMEVTRLAVERINQQGGILGRRVVPVVVDGQSNWNVFEDGARRLITDEKVSVIFGCWTSASRRTVKPVLEELDHLLIYPVQYEGLESSPNIFYIGASPNQQITPAFQWLMGNKLSKRFYLVGSDYVFPRSANAILNDRITEAELTIVGERYIPLGSADVADIVSDIVATKPDVILNTINGDSNVAFFRELRKAGITPQDIPTVSFSIAEHELRSMNISEMAGDLAAWNYFQSIDNEENEEFVQLIKERYGQERVVTDPMEAAWIGVHLWAQAVKEAGTDEVTAVREAMKEQTFNAPSGTISINPENQHAYKVPRIGEITDTGQFEIQFVGVRPINPEPYPQTRTREEWTQFLDDLYNGWGGNWAAPAK